MGLLTGPGLRPDRSSSTIAKGYIASEKSRKIQLAALFKGSISLAATVSRYAVDRKEDVLLLSLAPLGAAGVDVRVCNSSWELPLCGIRAAVHPRRRLTIRLEFLHCIVGAKMQFESYNIAERGFGWIVCDGRMLFSGPFGLLHSNA
jgi:hypothetical protein